MTVARRKRNRAGESAPSRDLSGSNEGVHYPLIGGFNLETEVLVLCPGDHFATVVRGLQGGGTGDSGSKAVPDQRQSDGRGREGAIGQAGPRRHPRPDAG